MKLLKKLGLGLFAALGMIGAVYAAQVPLLTGPNASDPSQLLNTLNTLINSINSNVTQQKLFANGVTVGTTAVTTEETLYTYTLPANYLANLGDSLRIQCGSISAATATNKTLKLYFGAASFSTGVVASNAGAYNLELIVTRTGAATQMVYGYGTGGTGGVTPIIPAYTAGTDDLTTALVIKCTGQNGTANANDILGRFMLVESVK